MNTVLQLECSLSVIVVLLVCGLQRPHLCHLLYLLTRKDDVRPFRIRALLQIHQASVCLRIYCLC